VDRTQKLAEVVTRAWATLAIVIAAGVAFFWPRLADLLLYTRADIFAGQVWRMWTGHLVHFNANHLLWDLAVFLPAGVWLERTTPSLARWFYALAPLAISALLLTLEPTLSYYAGLSGLATGVLVLLALVQLRRDTAGPRWSWAGVLLLVAAKVVVELRAHAPLVVRFDPGVRTVPLAHIGGIACALIAALLVALRSRRADR
jgi:rhomboid family GlyGly-CTERM serine protease